MIYLFDKDEKLIKIVRKSAVKTALQKYALTTERYVSDRLTVELKGLNADELEQVEYMAIQTMEDAHAFHYFYVAQKSSDELTTLIGVQSGIEELRKSPVYDKRPKNTFARDVITDLLAGTNWQARFVGETTPHSTNFYYTSVFDALKKVCEVWDLEMQFFVEMNGNRIGARYIDFKQKIGQAVGKRVVYGHNALQILQEVERTNIFTALIGRGKGEETGDGYGRKITFENVVWSRTQGKPVDKPKGRKYLELPLMTRQYGIKNADGSMRPKIGFVDFSEEENPEVLIERTYRALIDAARPQLTLKTSSVYLRGVKVGDTIRVVRHDKKLDYDTRIFEITFNRLNNQSSDIKLGDRIGESNEAKAQTIADKAVEQFVNNEFSNFVQNLPDYLPSADGFNNNWYGAEDPTVKYPGKVLINDIWYKPDPEHEGHKIMLRWTGEVWEEILRTYDSEALRDRIAEEVAKVNRSMQAQSEEHDRQVADILSKNQSIESLANQAKTDAASALARANQVKTEAIADARAQVATVSQALNTAKTELQSAIASADQKARDSQASATALRNDLNLQASKILEQAQAQTALTSRVTTVETLADGTRSTVTELSKTVNKATGDIASVSSRTKTVEDTLSQTRTQYEALTQSVNAQTGQIDSISRRTGTIEAGLTGIQERFESIKIGNRNYFKNAKDRSYLITNAVTQDFRTYIYEDFWKNTLRFERNKVRVSFDIAFSPALPQNFTTRVHFAATPWYSSSVTFKGNTTDVQHIDLIIDLSSSDASYWADNVFIRFSNSFPVNTNVSIKNMMLYISDFREDYAEPSEDFRSELGTYIRNATENSAELVKRIETADGKAVDAKTYAQQTAEGFRTRLESLETYKNEEGTRASQYLTASRTETAKQITAERTSIANNYVAKSIYDENVRGTTLKLNEIKSTADTAKQNLATYQETVDRKLEELTSSTQTLDGKINTASAKVDTVAGQIRTEISEVEGKILTTVDGRNLIKNGGFPTNTQYWSGQMIVSQHNYYYNGQRKLFLLQTTGTAEIMASTNRFDVKRNTDYTLSFVAFSSSRVRSSEVWFLGRKSGETADWTTSNSVIDNRRFSPSKAEYVTVTFNSGENDNGYIRFDNNGSTDGQMAVMYFGEVMLVEGTIARTYEPSTEEVMEEVRSVKTTITQTASGVEQLSTSLSTTDNKVTTAEAKIRNLVDEVSSKVSQTDYNTLTGRVDNNETAITQNATEISKRLTKTQVESAITDKGYQTKSDVDNNITGRGYITNSALQPYALSTTVQTLVKETADSFSRTISETKALIPSGESNLVKWGRPGERSEYANAEITTHSFFYNNGVRMYVIRNSRSAEKIVGFNRFAVERNNEYTLYFKGFNNSALVNMEVWFLKRVRGSVADYDDAQQLVAKTLSWTGAEEIAVTFNVGNFDEGYIRFDNNGSVAEGTSANLYFGDVSVKKGKSNNGWSPSVEELATVTALHNVTDTVDSHTRTIGAVGEIGSILDNVSKVTQTANGLVTEVTGEGGLKTQVSTLAGSYAIKNLTKAGDVLGQINLNKDGSVKIDGKLVQITGATYIQDGVISAAKIGDLSAGKITSGTLDAARIKANSISGSKIAFDEAFFNGLTANEAYLEKLFAKNAFITSVQAVSLSASKISGGILTATNEALKMDLNNANITFNQNATINFNSANNALVRRKGTHTAFVHFNDVMSSSDGGVGSLYASIGVTSSGDGIDSESSGRFAGLRAFRGARGLMHNATLDQLELYGDRVLLMDDFDLNRGFMFRPAALSRDDFIDMNQLVTCVRALRDMWAHYKNSNGTLSDLLNNRSNSSVNASWENMHSFK
ncbi:TPA: phage tail protein [Streptococcus suis]|nr:phage tail protein [Streptococcus suis]